MTAARTETSAPVGTESGAAEYAWECITMNAGFAPRDGAGALSHAGRMWLIGGWNPSDKEAFPRTCGNDVWSSADGATWRQERPNSFCGPDFDPAAAWEGRHTAGYAVLHDALWIIGGDPLQGHYQGDVWRSPDGRSWTRVAASAEVGWHPRALHHTVAHDGRLWVLGGQTLPQFAPGTEVVYGDVWCSADGRVWEHLAPLEPCWCPRGMIGGGAVLHGRIWVLGGGRYDTPSRPERAYYNDVWSSADGVHWTCHTAAAPWVPRQYHEVAAWDDKLWVLEGYSGANRNDVWYSADGTHWTELRGTPWKPRHAASVFVFADALWVVAGNNMESDVWRLRRVGAGQGR